MKNRPTILSCLKRYVKGFRDINVSVNNVVLAHNELLRDKVAIVTGASRGIGYSIAETYIQAGAKVIGIAKTEANLMLAKEKLGENFHYVVADISKKEELSSIVSQSLSFYEQIDILVNAAGIKNGQDERYWEFSSEDFDYAIAINAKAPFFLSRDVIKYFLKNGKHGHIINVIGIKGMIGEGSPYSMSKFGLTGMTKGLARRFAPDGIVINGISPGATMSGQNVLAGNNNMLHLDAPNMRMANPQEIANIALLLASGMADNLVGSIITCDGGESLQYQNKR